MPTFHLKFQTNELTPPPYAYAVEIHSNPIEKGIQVAFEINYLERETLTIDEIIDEGFTENDDFKLKVNLPKIWQLEIDELLASSTFEAKETLSEEEEYLEINGKFPNNTESWKQLLEELQQAIFEKAEREAPLNIQLLRVSKTEKEMHAFSAKFVDRSFNYTHNKQIESLPWEKLNSFLKDIFGAEFKYDKAKESMPKNEGIHINLGDGYWMELGIAFLIQPSRITKWLQ